ncbi:hypothetical protein [Salinibacter ruber]|jgi:hypothetical protein|uniref:Uncharacterized protein n=3 Tax=Salinibacter ruber TaxID=146919 RepID=A0A9X2ULA2_9BACT|nr:hypothetical protein [Salinibacter ruber]CBH25119.1 conserved hypothetical protein [Salinibacter ruber M8]MBB4089386.1 hypothetical protein [Salinibacter ruber]MCS3611888.1 hypothetical protein [Salinibacter ruber]MCS3615421.1 hypothetical protein [Salinibacter ruber]MCS3628185.1 hypothetical protein [Salinibacter ruber]
MTQSTNAMKLVAIMTLDAYRDDVHALLREREIEVFSELDIEGHHQSSAAGAAPAWFGSGTPPADSTLTWAFLDDDQADHLLDAIADFNERRDLERPVRGFRMDVDRAV